MKEEVFVATVQIAVLAESIEGACDGISETLDTANGFVLDWAYLRVGGQRLYPAEQGVSLEDYTEGDFLL